MGGLSCRTKRTGPVTRSALRRYKNIRAKAYATLGNLRPTFHSHSLHKLKRPHPKWQDRLKRSAVVKTPPSWP